jgi:hypothetical protein
MLYEVINTVILEWVCLKRYQTLRWMLNLDVLIDEVYRILTAPNDLFDLRLL